MSNTLLAKSLFVKLIIESFEYDYDDEVRDTKVSHMVESVREQKPFNKWVWPRGSMRFEKYKHTSKKIEDDEPENKKHIVAKSNIGRANKKNAVLEPKRTRKTERSP
ncbi:hypothetical protein Bca52824_034806 [Brassica carinata]|uniref:Uncharacterized protein n=1 Tax=Brassica carinata TaxID=52824 RepID=A0A8X7V158_BRACI|nr:hypothetical protein Bca52824_034806 [Brassica carinata]